MKMFQTKQNDYETLKKDLEQLRREVRIERMKVSKSVEDIIRFCQQYQDSDPLLNKIPSSDNPFTHQDKPCAVL
ncbi:guanine nucleotide-binding protein G(I)/G(S)/G(O) subunit gamma-7-like [Xenia sp. Carnegie-2017]|uniref:guanine nucleotide-binding protein G(I)/G(S)/G(O) subunit gamma-7-like n=1 Tax=Xenia sp. Carnegie-2017 TaxID=2897299 RepID=UPI001F04469E|nr:guanine nucleotide-binding protein G(I)/G(S)/G(O) subunit gamma-7-like [Xenia sp. Carnegie-2017]